MRLEKKLIYVRFLLNYIWLIVYFYGILLVYSDCEFLLEFGL